MTTKILGISASLRNARRGLGNVDLIRDIKSLHNEEELASYLNQEAKIHLKNFQDSGRKSNTSFDLLYKNLRKLKGDKGLSNSEILLVAALWSSYNMGSEIDHISLSEYFNEENEVLKIDELKSKIISSDGIIVSGPVYFGDRGSLAQAFINLMREDTELKKLIKNKVYAGCSVGAKRNGGQETLLVYQIWDMLQIGFLGVGNDCETTSQYGGTGHAGDIGTCQDDDYGIWTAMGTGRRITRVSQMLNITQESKIKDHGRIGFFILQDKDEIARSYVDRLVEESGFMGEVKIEDISKKEVKRCLACDICPTHIDLDTEYRCIIKSKKDNMSDIHHNFLDIDLIIPVAYSAIDRKSVTSNYQRFIERTRYIRRGDYVMSDIVSCPLVIEELGSHENMSLRMLTSTLRHHTILSKPMNIYLHEEESLNFDSVKEQFKELIETFQKVTVGRLLSSEGDLSYNPVGYILAPMKDVEDEALGRRKEIILDRQEKKMDEIKSRLSNK